MGYHSEHIDDRLISNLLPDELPDSYSALDVGCGLGQLILILEIRFPKAKLSKFVGLDIVEPFIAHCTAQFQQFEFLTADFIEWEAPTQFDLVIAAGVLVSSICM